MSYIPETANPFIWFPEKPSKSGHSITIYALKENRRPVGFAPWPEEPAEAPAPKKAKKPKKKVAA